MRRLRRALLIFAAAVAAAGPVLADTLIEAGRRIYEDGMLPDGRPLAAMRPEGFTLEGRFAACGTCHRPSGMGSVEGLGEQAILVPPVAGPVLFADAPYATAFLDDSHHYIPNETWRRAMTRPAYDEPALEVALRTGVNSAGDSMAAPMPLYELESQDLAALVAYLKQLGSKSDPGVEPGALHLATVVTPDADPGDAEAMLGVLAIWGRTARSAGRPWRLHEWRLSGPPDTWAVQLKARYEEQNVFALLSGLGASEWGPVHEFCESRSLACVLPSVDVARSSDGHFSLYYAEGVTLEAQILAKHLQEEDSASRGRILHLYSGDSARLASEAFNEAWKKRGASPESLALRHHVTAPSAALREVKNGDTLVLWLDADDIAQLATELASVPTRNIYVSALLASPEDLDLPADWKRVTQFVTLFDDFGMQAEIARLRLERWLEQNGLAAPANRRLQADAYAAAYLFNEAVAAIGRQEVRRPPVPLTREHVLEVLEDRVAKYDDGTKFIDTEIHVAWYGRMSLGPGQRIAVRGGSIARYASPESQRLVAVGDRIVP